MKKRKKERMNEKNNGWLDYVGKEKKKERKKERKRKRKNGWLDYVGKDNECKNG